MPPPAKRAKGLTLPGYNYLGPFNPLFNGKPVNKADFAARKHDFGYSDLLNKGHNPYLYFNSHDQTLLDELKDDTSWGGAIAHSVFSVKKAIAPALAGEQRAANRAHARHLYFARLNRKPGGPAAKKAKMDASSTEVDAQSREQDTPDGARSGTAGAAVGGGGGGRSGSGVGFSTGGWDGGTLFSDTHIITNNTRQFLVDIKEGHKYTLSTIGTGQQDADKRAFKTPWTYFNFNSYAGHFSPNDWQRLLNEYVRFRPKHMYVKIYNLQIKQITSDGAQGNTYTNDLTAGLHILCDGSHQYPYVQHPWDEMCIPELPSDIWRLPQYAYLLSPFYNTNGSDGTEALLNRMMPAFILENSNHEVLRTGEATDFTFEFDTEWVENDRSYCSTGMLFNPLVGTNKLYQTNGVAYRQQPYSKSSIWMPGPGLNLGYHIQQNGGAAGIGIQNVYNDGTNMDSNTFPAYTGTSIDPILGAQASTDAARHAQFKPGDGDHNPTTNPTINSMNVQNSFTRGTTFSYNNTQNSTASYTRIESLFNLPNMAWDSIQLSRYNPIWVKVPRTNRHTLIDTPDGTLPMTHPPGTIFMKMAKIPVPGSSDSYLNIYATGQVSCQIVWEAERYMTKNWRPERRTTVSDMTSGIYNFDGNGAYALPRNATDAMYTRQGITKTL